MSQLTLLRGARQLLTLAGPDGVRSGTALQCLHVIPDGSVLVQDGVIVEIGSTRRIENLKEARTALEIDVHGSVIMPGFIDPSLRVTLNRPSPSGSIRSIRMGQFYDETLELLRSCVLNGTLTAELKGTAALNDYGSDLGVLRRLAKIGNNPAGTVRCWQLPQWPETESDISDFCETLQRLLSKSLVQFIELPLTDDVQLNPRLLAGIEASSVGVKILWSGSDPELLSRALTYLRPFALFSGKPLEPDEIAALHGYPGVVVFAPGRALGNAGLTGVRAAIDAGLAVALSSGYDAVAYPAYSMQMAVSLASVYGQLSLDEAISASTINAAHAIGCGDTRGSLMRGRRADILVLNLPDYREIPRQFGINHVRMAIRDGNVIMNRGGWKMGTHETTLPDRVRAQRVGGA